MSEKTHGEIVQESYDAAIAKIAANDTTFALQLAIQEKIDAVLDNAETNKGVLAVLMTLVAHKVLDPNQDIRCHQAQIKGGFTGRTIDTNHITPFLQRNHFPAMAQSGWLTRSLEQPFPYTLDYQGKIRPQELKDAFLGVIDCIQTKGADPKVVLCYIMYRLICLRDSKTLNLAKPQKLSISKIISLLEKHFNYGYRGAGASRLPVLAVYAAYQCLVNTVSRYKGMSLCPLESHNSADRRSGRIGDIEVSTSDGVPFEGVEVKHGIVITPQLINESYEKFKDKKTDRYYLLTTANMDSADVEEIEKTVEKIAHVHGCQVIVNGVYSSIRYYLRMLSDSAEFVDRYVELLKIDESVKFQHKEAWNDIVDQMGG